MGEKTTDGGEAPEKVSHRPFVLSPERAKEGLSPLQGSYNDGATRFVSGASPPPVFCPPLLGCLLQNNNEKILWQVH